MSLLSAVYGELTTEIIKIATGKLFAEEQIKSITSHTVGRYLAEFFPVIEEERETQEKVEKAKFHIIEASSILTDMQKDLELKTKNLDALLVETGNKKALAERYENLVNTNKEKFSALRSEMEDALRNQLIQQSEKGRGVRRLVSVIIGVGTLIVGAALGAYFKDIVALAGGLIA